METIKVEIKAGWAMPGLAKKFHYFIENMALCGKWLYSGELDKDNGGQVQKDDCKECFKRLRKNK